MRLGESSQIWMKARGGGGGGNGETVGIGFWIGEVEEEEEEEERRKEHEGAKVRPIHRVYSEFSWILAVFAVFEKYVSNGWTDRQSLL